MRLLVTGGTGFIGARMLPLLSNHDVMILSRRNDTGAPMRDGSRVRFHCCDLNREDTWKSAIADFKPESCIHLAWDGLPDYSIENCERNFECAKIFLETLIATGLKRLVVAGSCWEYGNQRGALAESQTPVQPGQFALSKMRLLSWIDAQSRDHDLGYRWARVFFAYGPGQRSTSLIPSAREAAKKGNLIQLQNPHRVEDFVHVDDVANALKCLLETDIESGIYNVGCGQAHSVGRVASLVATRYGITINLPKTPKDEGNSFWADISKIGKATGWRPKIGLKQGIDHFLDDLDGRVA